MNSLDGQIKETQGKVFPYQDSLYYVLLCTIEEKTYYSLAELFLPLKVENDIQNNKNKLIALSNVSLLKSKQILLHEHSIIWLFFVVYSFL